MKQYLRLFKLNGLAYVSVLTGAFLFAGVVNNIPELSLSMKNHKVAEDGMGDKDKDLISFEPLKNAFYQKVVNTVYPMYPSFDIKAVEDKEAKLMTIQVRSENIGDFDKVESLVNNVKATLPGVYWDMDKACFGMDCKHKIEFTLIAKKVVISK